MAEAADAVGWAEAIVVTTTDPAYAKAIAAARPDQVVLDFAQQYDLSGLLWKALPILQYAQSRRTRLTVFTRS